jgi:hypothetical protein
MTVEAPALLLNGIETRVGHAQSEKVMPPSPGFIEPGKDDVFAGRYATVTSSSEKTNASSKMIGTD